MGLRKLLDDLQSNLWFRPLLWVVGLALLAIVLTTIDYRLREVEEGLELPWFLRGGVEGARTMLGSISTAMLTAATFTFSAVMVAVVQTANAYSPRVLREYLGDTANQHALGLMLGSFVFSLLVLRGVHATDDLDFVPLLAVNGALALALAATGAFIFFINHVAQSIKVDNVINLVLSYTEEMMDDIFPSTLGESWPDEDASALPATSSSVIRTEDSGYVQLYRSEELVELATTADIIIRLEYGVGDYALRNTPLATIWPAGVLDEKLTKGLRKAIVLGKERTLVQDVMFGVRQLSDIALRGLSPSLNDPTTARHCLNALATVLMRMLEREPVSPYRCDETGKLRIIAPEITFAHMLDHALSQIRRYGAADVGVLIHLLSICRRLGLAATRPEERDSLWRFVQTVAHAADEHVTEAADRRQINERLGQTARALDEDVRPLLLTMR